MTDFLAQHLEDVAKLPEFPTPRDGTCPFAPPPELREMASGDVAVQRIRTWDDTTPWLVTSHATQRAIMSDPRLSANIGTPGYPHTTEAMKEHAAEVRISINNADGAEHVRFRRTLTSSFTRGRMEKMREHIQQITNTQIDQLLAGPKGADLNEVLSLPLPSEMICVLLGVPYEDHDFFQKYAGVTNARFKSMAEAVESTKTLVAYIEGLIEKKMENPAEDVLSDLGERIKAGTLTMAEAGPLGHILLVAGHDTSANMITLGTALLLENPDQLELLKQNADDPKFVANAVEELLRYLTIPHLLARRVVVEDIEVDGQLIKAGEGLIASLPAANWDPEAFPEPERLDLTRKANHHHSFGWGPHQCVGQQLARIELEVVFSTLFTRIPTLAMAVPFSELRFKEDSQAYGIYELPVTW
jgi:cytochrome P450